MTQKNGSALDLFGGVTCELDQKPGVGYVSDFTGGAWLCAAHLKIYELAWRSVGRTLNGFLRKLTAEP